MAITTDDFNKIWASTSPLTPYEFSESQYKEGWNFIGVTPPSRQMWDFLQKQNDEKLKYLLDNFDDYAKKTDLGDYLPLSGGTMTGSITYSVGTIARRNVDTSYLQILGGSSDSSGSNLVLYGENSASGGQFELRARNSNGFSSSSLVGKTDGTLTWGGQPLLPVGIVQAFAGNTIPNGWLLCNGSAVSRTTYANLFAVIGTTYGSGDGSTTFSLPNLIDKFIEGSATAGTEHSAGLPNITGQAARGNMYGTNGSTYSNGAFRGSLNQYIYNTGSDTTTSSRDRISSVDFDASKSNSIYGNSATVQPPALTMQYIIKY